MVCGVPISRPSMMISSFSRHSPKPLILNVQLKWMLSEQGLTRAAGSKILTTRVLATERVRYFFVSDSMRVGIVVGICRVRSSRGARTSSS